MMIFQNELPGSLAPPPLTINFPSEDHRTLRVHGVKVRSGFPVAASQRRFVLSYPQLAMYADREKKPLEGQNPRDP